MKRLNILAVALISASVLFPAAAQAKDGVYAYKRFQERVAKETKKKDSAKTATTSGDKVGFNFK